MSKYDIRYTTGFSKPVALTFAIQLSLPPLAIAALNTTHHWIVYVAVGVLSIGLLVTLFKQYSCVEHFVFHFSAEGDLLLNEEIFTIDAQSRLLGPLIWLVASDKARSKNTKPQWLLISAKLSDQERSLLGFHINKAQRTRQELTQ